MKKKKFFFFFFLWKTNEADLRQQLPLVSKFLLEIIRSQRSHQLPKCRRVKGSEATLTEEQFHEKKSTPSRSHQSALWACSRCEWFWTHSQLRCPDSGQDRLCNWESEGDFKQGPQSVNNPKTDLLKSLRRFSCKSKFSDPTKRS